MNRLAIRTLAAAALAFGALATMSAAHARSDVYFSIGVQPSYGYGYSQPAPVYVQPAPVYVQPAPVYVEPRPIYYPRHRHHYRGWGDYDRDGVPDRFDRRPYNPYRY